MLGKQIVLALLVLLGLATTAVVPAHPVQARVDDKWSGVWIDNYGGRLKLDQDGLKITGTYTNGGSSMKIWGELSGRKNTVLKGEFGTSRHQPSGQFRFELDSGYYHFDGWYRAHGAARYPWNGDRHGV